MKRKDYKIFKSEIKRLLREIDSSFLPNFTYRENSSLVRNVANLRYLVDGLYNGLIH